ncbi:MULTISPECIES: hypothetical protein [Aneurinibacillus]|jgi:chromosome segregation ATPase|uniref:Lipoprotein n=1 Tax=Aneurinibacillus danicus TaxID=267746 RepID=A0A511V7E2_9BACL|nr:MULTISPECIES: hypothetical protein [Aneurinibacillus]GEN34071.1 hypothetical protein ADA01nite_15310 [Aneurinibacillus danicus]
MKRAKKQSSRILLTAIVIGLTAALTLGGCRSKDSVPTEQELTAKIAEKQEQKREQKINSARQELDRYFESVAASVKKLGEKRAAFFEAFTGLSEQKLTKRQARTQVATAIADYEKTLGELKTLQLPAYKEVQSFHQEIHRTMGAYVPLMKKAEQGLRQKDAETLKEVEKQMAILDDQVKKTLEKSSKLQVKVNTGQ